MGAGIKRGRGHVAEKQVTGGFKVFSDSGQRGSERVTVREDSGRKRESEHETTHNGSTMPTRLSLSTCVICPNALSSPALLSLSKKTLLRGIIIGTRPAVPPLGPSAPASLSPPLSAPTLLLCSRSPPDTRPATHTRTHTRTKITKLHPKKYKSRKHTHTHARTSPQTPPRPFSARLLCSPQRMPPTPSNLPPAHALSYRYSPSLPLSPLRINKWCLSPPHPPPAGGGGGVVVSLSHPRILGPAAPHLLRACARARHPSHARSTTPTTNPQKVPFLHPSTLLRRILAPCHTCPRRDARTISASTPPSSL